LNFRKQEKTSKVKKQEDLDFLLELESKKNKKDFL